MKILEVEMVRSLSVYLVVLAIVMLFAGLFLPTGRGLSVMIFGNGQANQVDSLEAEEMGCIPKSNEQLNNNRPVYLTNFESFFSSTGVLCGKSSLSMLLTGKYWWSNILLLLPVCLGIYVIFRLFFQPYARNHDRILMLMSGILGFASLMIWWGIWVKFRAYPAIGFWVSLSGTIILLIAGFLAPHIEPYKERHHPHLD